MKKIDLSKYKEFCTAHDEVSEEDKEKIRKLLESLKEQN